MASSQERTSVFDQTVDRSLKDRRATAADEVQRLIDASFTLIQRTGQLEPRVSEIVREAGLHNQAFYRHFRSKHELLVAVLDQGSDRLARYLEHRMKDAGSPIERVRAWISGLLEQALNRESAERTRPFALARGRLSETFPQEVRESERRVTALARDAIRDGIEAGDLPSADAERDADWLHLLAMGWVERSLQPGSDPLRADAGALEDFALAGLARRVDSQRGGTT